MPIEELQGLCGRLGIQDIPASWLAGWDGYEAWQGAGGCEALNWELPPNAAEVFGLPEGSVPALQELFQAIRAHADLRALASFLHYMAYHMPGGMERYTNGWAVPDELFGFSVKLLFLAVLTSGADHALANFAATGVSKQVALLSLGYIGYYTSDIRKKRGVWGLESLGWLSCYCRAEIFRLGRLTFKEGVCGSQFREFKNRVTGELIVLCPPSKFRTDGQADGANGVYDPEAWTATFEMGEDAIVGNPVRNCVAEREPIRLPISDWELIMGPGVDIVEVHVAGGSKMLHEDCVDAYRQAIEFFPRNYPGRDFRGFTIWSWLLDPALAEILPPDSNIVQFQRDFYQLPISSNEAQCYDLVFGDSAVDPTKITPTTGLQRAIIDYVAAGGKMKSAAGYITWERALELVSGQ